MENQLNRSKQQPKEEVAMGQTYTFQVSLLLLREGEIWVAQGLEYDIVAQGKSLKEAIKAFERTCVGQIAIDVKHGNRPLEGIEQAPAEIWEMFDGAHKLDERKPFRLPRKGIPPNCVIAAGANDMRVFA
jgi:hypothetical protein